MVQVLRDDTCHMVNSRVSKDHGAFITNRLLSLYQSTRGNFPEDLNIQIVCTVPALGNLLLNILGAVANLRKATVSVVMSVCLSIRPPSRVEQLGSHWTVFHENDIFEYFFFLSETCR